MTSKIKKAKPNFPSSTLKEHIALAEGKQKKLLENNDSEI